MPYVLYLTAFLSSMLLTRVMMRLRIMAMPSDRSSHATPTPSSGGLAIIVSVLFLNVLLCLLYPGFLETHLRLFVAVGCAFGLGVMGLVDDIAPLSFTSRLLLQGICGGLCVLSGVTLQTLHFPLLGAVELGAFAPIVTIFWVVGFTNAFNFWDGLNGLSSGSAIVALSVMMALAFPSLSLPMFLFCGTLVAAILGFFVFNFPVVGFPQAKIFMGDVGSQFIGFLLAELALLMKEPTLGHLSIYTMPLLFFATIFDVSFTLIDRWRRDQPLTQAHKEYLFQRLQQSGWTHARVSLLHFCFIVFHGVGAVILQKMPAPYQWVVFIPCLGLQIVYARWVMQRSTQSKVLN